MADEFDPCPFCGEVMTKTHASDCYFEVKNSRDHDQVVKAWNRRAPSTSTAPTDELPPRVTPEMFNGLHAAIGQLEESQKARDAIRARLDAATEPCTETLLRIIAENTGKRISLSLDDLDCYLAVARAALASKRGST